MISEGHYKYIFNFILQLISERHYKYLTYSARRCSLLLLTTHFQQMVTWVGLELDGAGVIRGDANVSGGGVSRRGGVTRGGVTIRYLQSRKSNGEVLLVGD